ncbi:MAG TPA: hypothetical protein VK841_22780 [Polyangiaceae bacterium]|nr:hypothetical protein [Polyangiaceae bacterium]
MSLSGTIRLGSVLSVVALLTACGGTGHGGMEPGVGGDTARPDSLPDAPTRADGRCRYLPECYLQGRCAKADDPKSVACVAKNSDDCQHSQECAALGRCVAHNGVCAASEEGCAKSLACWEAGLCALGPNGNACASTTVAQCQQSELCSKEAKCSLADSRCLLGGSLDCETSGLCQKFGKCEVIRGECRPARDEHCAKSDICRTQHLCKEVRSECVDENLEVH